MNDEEQSATGSNFAALLEILDETPGKLARLTEGLSTAELRWKNSEDEFSTLENFCHLKDLELDGYTRRINQILTESEQSSPLNLRLAGERPSNPKQTGFLPILPAPSPAAPRCPYRE